ncbi:hypothetical protein PhCBS80983_g02105 [Powellomyces hirtus]|uniref:Uncharacterized protein n=1 Tax=Powellomyces hirtus TaxID=109895 RepID=A0A507E7B3_9FUNG|nr:hypothetical protein PhCBS80983_g02105 [Powellomyces hirtus]
MVGIGRKKGRAKKSVNALILATGVIATPSVPCFFSAIKMHLRARTKADTGPVIAPRTLAPPLHQQHTAAVPPLLAGPSSLPSLATTRRAQSLSVLPMNVRGGVGGAGRGLQQQHQQQQQQQGGVIQIQPQDGTKKNEYSVRPPPFRGEEEEEDGARYDEPRFLNAIPKAADCASPPRNTHNDHDDGDDDNDGEEELDFDAEFGFTVTPAMPLVFLGTNQYGNKSGGDPKQQETPLQPHQATPRGPKSRPPNVISGGGASGGVEDRNISPRRIQSAPTNMLKMYDESLLLANEDDEFDEEAGVNKDEWFVPSVKAKAERRLGRGGLVGMPPVYAHDEDDEDEDEDNNGVENGRLQMDSGGGAPGGGGAGMESWDDDFDDDHGGGGDDAEMNGGKDGAAGGGLLHIPRAVRELQTQIKGDAVNLKKFALHIEDLRLLHSDATDMAAGVPASRLAPLQSQYARELTRVQVLLALGDSSDDDGDATRPKQHNSRHLLVPPHQAAPTEHHMHVLVEMLITGPDHHSQQKKKTGGGGGLSPAAVKSLQQMVADGTLVFGVELVPALLKHMGPLKIALAGYVAELRRVLLGAGDDS